MNVTTANEQMINGKTRRASALLLTTAVYFVMGSQAFAQTVTTASGTTDDAPNNPAIAANATPAITVEVGAATKITAGAVNNNLTVAPSGGGNNEGAVTVNVAGQIGALSADGKAVANFAGLRVFGANKAGNTVNVNVATTGLVANGVIVNGAGDKVTVTNAGTVFAGINANGLSDVTVTSTGAVRSGSVQGFASNTATSTTTAGITTFKFTSGNVKVSVGDVASADGTTKGAVFAFASNGNAEITVSGVAGDVNANGGFSPTNQIFGGSPAVNGATTTTSIAQNQFGSETAKVAVAATGNVGNVFVRGNGTSAANIDGAAITVNATAGRASTASQLDLTLDAKGNFTKQVSTSSSTPGGTSSSVVIGSTSVVTDLVNARTLAGTASVVVNGKVNTTGGSTTANSVGTSLASTSTDTFDPATGASTSSFVETRAATGGVASVTVGAGASTGKVDTSLAQGTVFATGDGGAKITNSGTIGGNANGNSNRSVLVENKSGFNSSDVSSADTRTVTFGASGSKTTSTIGGAVTITNDATGVIIGGVNSSALGDITNTNAGFVRGNTNLNSNGTSSVSSFSNSDVDTTTPLAAPNKTTLVTKATTSTASTRNGGSVTGVYSGFNGELNIAPSNGSIFQTADKASTLTVSGQVLGSVSSTAGNVANLTNSSASNRTEVLDDKGTGSFTGGTSSTATQVTNAGGVSTVNVIGKVLTGAPNQLLTADVNSSGSQASIVSLNGATVNGNVNANAFSGVDGQGQVSSKSATDTTFVQGVTLGVTTTTALTGKQSNSSVRVAGASTADILGSTKVGGSVNVNGLASASSKVNAAATIGGSLNLSAAGADTSSSVDVTYARDLKTTVVTGTRTTKSSTTPSIASGNAAAIVDGTVTGGITVTAERGSATVTLTGSTGGSILARSWGPGGAPQQVETTTVETFDGKAAASASTDIFAGPPAFPVASKTVTTSTSTQVGAAANVSVTANAGLVSKGASSVLGNITAVGLFSSTVTIGANTKIGAFSSGAATGTPISDGNVTASTRVSNSTLALTTTPTTSSEIRTTTVVGGAANLTNAGTIGGNAQATGTTASLTNTGRIFGNGIANAVWNNTVTDTSTTNIGNILLQTTVSKVTNTPNGGDAKIVNSAGGVANFLGVSGATGSITNSGAVFGNIGAGINVASGTTTTTTTATSTTSSVTPAAALFVQTYTLTNNGTIGGVVISGAFSGATKTSDIRATVDLNSGSATLGGVSAEINAAGAFQTATTVNLNGSGFLGADFVPGRNPAALALSMDAKNAGFLPVAVGGFVTGVTALNKTGAGTFVLNLRPFAAPTTPSALPTWSLDVGSFNINAGEIQLSSTGAIGVRGNIVNAGTLVLGRRIPTAAQQFGDSLVSSGTETIAGVTINQTGNFTQAATGTIVVALTPSLVRTGNVVVPGQGTANEPLGVVQAGVNIPFFTDPTKFGGANAGTPSRVNVTGDLNLAGTVQTDINRNSIFSNGDGFTLFTYTGAGTVTATVNTNITSRFVTIALKNDTAAKTVSLVATRSSYTAGATNANAQAAAAALDSTIPQIVTAIRSDAAGGAAFNSVGAIGRAQDLANIVSALDFRLTTAQAAQVFDELSSAEFHGSFAALDQNAVFNQAISMVTERRTSGSSAAGLLGITSEPGLHLWLTPVGNFAKFTDTSRGQSEVRADTYGLAGGVDLTYGDSGAAGLAFAYGDHSVRAENTQERTSGDTYTVGAYVTQGFGNLYATGSFGYGFTSIDTTRNLTLLARTITASYKGRQWNAAVEVGYDFAAGDFVLTPFGKVAGRRWSRDAITEIGGGGVGVNIAEQAETVFLPEVGARFTAALGDASGGFRLRPYGKVSYTFQGDIGSEFTAQFQGGGNAFTLGGVDTEGFVTGELGLEAVVNNRFSVFLGGTYATGGDNEAARVSGGIDFRF